MKTCFTAVSVLAVAVSFALGQGEAPKGPPKGKRPNPEAIFKKLDTNNDQMLSEAEFKAGPMGKRDPEQAAKAFKKGDTDNNGSLSLEEFKANMAKRAPGGTPKGGKAGKGGKGGKKAPPAEPKAE